MALVKCLRTNGNWRGYHTSLYIQNPTRAYRWHTTDTDRAFRKRKYHTIISVKFWAISFVRTCTRPYLLPHHTAAQLTAHSSQLSAQLLSSTSSLSTALWFNFRNVANFWDSRRCSDILSYIYIPYLVLRTSNPGCGGDFSRVEIVIGRAIVDIGVAEIPRLVHTYHFLSQHTILRYWATALDTSKQLNQNVSIYGSPDRSLWRQRQISFQGHRTSDCAPRFLSGWYIDRLPKHRQRIYGCEKWEEIDSSFPVKQRVVCFYRCVSFRGHRRCLWYFSISCSRY